VLSAVVASTSPSGQSSLVRLTRWEYVCGSCGVIYDVPSADLSFAYGTFLARTGSGLVAVWDAHESTTDEVQRLIETDPRVRGLTRSEVLDLVHQVAPVSFDPAPSGEYFTLAQTPGCPQCGSLSVTAFVETDDVAGEATDLVTHAEWDNLTHEERARRIHHALDGLLDGA
jgi:hypothetical protein